MSIRIEYDTAFVPAGEMNTALALVVSKNGHQATLWFHSDKSFNHFLETNESPNDRLKGIKLEGIKGVLGMEEAITGKDIIFLTPRAKDLREIIQRLAPIIRKSQIVVIGTKGIDEHHGHYYTPTQVIEQEIPDIKDRLAVLSGPNFAKQIALDKITGTTVAAYINEVGEAVKDSLDNENFWVDLYEGNPFDVELIGAYKNVVGLAIGFAMTLDNYDENTGAFILQKALKEAEVLCEAMGCNRRVLMELCGIGDLALFMNSATSRNVEAGYKFGTGEWTREDLFVPDRTIEGVRSARIIRELARQYRVLMPLTRGVDQVIHQGANPGWVIKTLLAKPWRRKSLATIGRKNHE